MDGVSERGNGKKEKRQKETDNPDQRDGGEQRPGSDDGGVSP